ncbi:hypothetical protein COO60DRAFT_1624241 [Scenedesmus sp. NREL 46B-D3]|nr:hypothetical protein COO60DRAFT_1624241 [Scenedesmus sp. NREL 46B-D3]
MAAALSSRLALLTALHVLVALIFLKGFLLTRVELPDTSSCTEVPCNSRPAYSKAVVLIVDALRYDFVCSDGSSPASFQGRFPKTLGLVGSAGDAAVVARFVADTPTITMSRLKALLTGGLPTFLDVGQSFSASALSEDNLLHQLRVQGKKLVVMGDDTWMQLAKDAFVEAHPYPSFDVNDLHTVDDGVWEHLLPLLAQSDSWDVLIAHYLGVDHAGHTYGVGSRQMETKLDQMDSQVSHVMESLAAQAGPEGPYAETLLLVLSDHGQTLGGDHEAKVAAVGSSNNISGDGAAVPGSCPQQCWPWLCSSSMSQIDLTPTIAHLLGVSIPFGNLGKLPPHLFVALATNSSTGSANRAAGASAEAWLPQYAAALHANAHQVHTYLNRYAVVGGLPAADLSSANKLYQRAQQLWAAKQAAAAATAASGPNQQADSTTAAFEPTPVNATEQLIVAQLAFLDAAVGLARRRFTLFQQGPIWAACAMGVAVLVLQLAYCRQAASSMPPSKACSTDCSTILLFTGLAALHALGLFSVGLIMGEGRLQCVLLGAATLLMLRAVLSAVLRARSVAAEAAAATAWHGADTATGMAASSVLSDAVRQDRDVDECRSQTESAAESAVDAVYWCSWQPVGTAVAAAVLLLACNVLLQAMGLIDRAGQDPHDKAQPSGDLLVGPDAAWQQLQLLCFTVAPLVCMRLLVSWWSAWTGRCCSSTAAPHDLRWDGKVLGVLVWVLKRVCTVQFCTLGIFWVAQLSGQSGSTAPVAAKLACAQLQQIVINSEALSKGCSFLMTCLSCVVGWDAVYGVLLVSVYELLQVAPSSLFRALAQLPMRLLLPRVVYASAVAAFCGTAVVLCLLAVCKQLCKQAAAKLNSGERCCSTSALGCQLNIWLCAVFAAAVVMVQGYKGPATMLVALVQAGCCCALQRLHAAASRTADGSAARRHPQQQHTSSSLQSVVGGGLWGMMGLQLFFCSSHFCEFSGLQYASAFIGFDSMVWHTSGSLLLLNTCGHLLLAMLSLPAFVAACTMADARQLQPQSRELVRQQLACSMLAVNSMRFAALVVCMISAAVQQQHILLWAIFAPKLCFELWFMVVTDVGQLLASALAGAVL